MKFLIISFIFITSIYEVFDKTKKDKFFQKLTYRIYSDKSLRCLFNFETLKSDAYQKTAINTGRRLFQSKNSYSFEVQYFAIVSFQITI